MFTICLQRYRISANMSQSELARKCDLTQQYISMLENDINGECLPTLAIIEKLGKALDINPLDLIEYKP